MSGIRPDSRALRLAAAVVLMLTLSAFATAMAGGVVRSSLERPDRSPPPFITIGPTIGGSPDWEPLRLGFSGSILFTPAAAAEILPTLYYWNTGLVLHGEYRDIAPDRNILTAEVVLRRYLARRTDLARGTSLFVGAGGGLALVGHPVAITADEGGEGEDAAAEPVYRRGEQRYYSFLAELGYESRMGDGLILIWKAQWRNYVWTGRDYSNWTIHAQIGIPIPW